MKTKFALSLMLMSIAFNEIFQDPDFQKKWNAIGSDVVGGSPDRFSQLIETERARTEVIIKDSGIKLE